MIAFAKNPTRRRCDVKSLKGKVAVVAGATRGAGRGIARMLGEAGATVYCTGRSSRTMPNTSGHHYAGRPETIEETAEMVDAEGATGIPVRVDHNDEAQVVALFERVKQDHKRLDVLVNVLTGPTLHEFGSVATLSVDAARAALEGWLWPHFVTCRYAAPLMIAKRSGLIVEIVEQHEVGYHGGLVMDMVETSLKRLAYALAEELAPKGIAALAITPGFMRTEAILDHFETTEATWQEAAKTNKEAKRFGFAGSETPCFVGRAVAALAADPNVAAKSGGVYGSWELSDEYGFEDVDGRRPHLWKYWQKEFPHLTSGVPKCGRTWSVVDTSRR
jgi:NAD(P)-dependent dehydrogenase (short-subunit alcohol dehydrogenase family)